MLPKSTVDLAADFTIKERPSGTFRLNRETDTLTGRVDTREAVEQAIYIMLNVERYKHLIHSWGFGVELADLYGRPMGYVQSEIKRRIKEALIQDSRITGVEGFQFEQDGKKLHVTFTVETIFGPVKAEKEVES